jgi:hypothetical protein
LIFGLGWGRLGYRHGADPGSLALVLRVVEKKETLKFSIIKILPSLCKKRKRRMIKFNNPLVYKSL